MIRTNDSTGTPGGKQAPEPARILDRKITLAKAVLLFERAWRAMLWPFVVSGLFLLISFANLWSHLPPAVHSLALVVFALGGLVSLAPLFRISMPDREAALRRLEGISGISHRPATSYEDALPEESSPEQRALWAAHRRRLAHLFTRLRPGLPHPRLDHADPYALRVALLLVLAVSLVFAGPEVRSRLLSAFELTRAPALAQFRLDAWVTPPLYTGKPPVVLADGFRNQSVRSVTVPEKSLLLVRVNRGTSGKPAMHLTGPDGSKKAIEATNEDGTLAEYRLTITDPGTVEIALGRVPAITWHFDLVKDTPPTIALTEDPSSTPRGSLRLDFKVQDDYGVAQAEARFELADTYDSNNEKLPPADTRDELEPPVIPLNLPRANAKVAEARVFRDLTAHPWAGLRVTMTLAARDQAGQTGHSMPFNMVLPARKFTKPLAKAIIEQRRDLVRNPRARNDVAQGLAALTIGAEHFIKDKIVYLGLRSTFFRLKSGRSADTASSVVDQLWDLALRVEDGDLPEAQAALRTAQEKLRRALEEGASDKEIQRLIAELRAALARFMQTLAEQARRKGNLAQIPEGLGQQKMLSSKDLEEMLRNIENLAKTGARDLAQRMLSELQGLVERLQMGAMNQNSRGQQMMKSVQGLGEIIGRQQKLLDDTFNQRRQRDGEEGREGRQGQRQGQLDREGRPGREGRQGQRQSRPGQQGRQGQGNEEKRGGEGSSRLGSLGDRQGAIREKLDQLLEQLRSFGARPPDQLDGAGRAMGESEKALEGDDLGRATQQQTLALDRLRQGTQQLAEQVLQSLSSRVGRGNQGQKDPFGRPERTQGPDLGTSVQVPDKIDIQRAREILEELRRRLSEPTRPMLELDYLERLIRQF